MLCSGRRSSLLLDSSFSAFDVLTLFPRRFNTLGFLPSVRLCRRLGLPSSVSKLVGALVVFALSAWMHAQALYSARHSLTPTPSGLAFASSLSSHVPLSSFYPPPWSSLSFIERYGTWIFFLAMPFAIVLETAWEARTRRRIGGWAGRVWTGMWIVGLGQAVVGRSWCVFASVPSPLSVLMTLSLVNLPDIRNHAGSHSGLRMVFLPFTSGAGSDGFSRPSRWHRCRRLCAYRKRSLLYR